MTSRTSCLSREKKKSEINWDDLYGQVVSLGIAPDYFLDKMGFEEIGALLKADDYNRRDSWEKVRQICFYNVAPYSEVKKPSDLWKFPWEAEKKGRKLSKDELKERVKKAKKIINGKSGFNRVRV